MTSSCAFQQLKPMPSRILKRMKSSLLAPEGYVNVLRCLVESKRAFVGSFSGKTGIEETEMANNNPPIQTISYVTISNEEKARELARSLVENRLAACVNIVKDVKSIYEWQGKIEEDSESMLIIKSDSTKSTQLIQFVERNHPYDCPEVVSLKIDSGSKKYLDWISATVSKPHVEKPSS